MKKEAPVYRRFSDLKRRAEKNGWKVYVSGRLDLPQPIDGPTVARRRRRDFTEDLVELQNLAKIGKVFHVQAIIEKPISNTGETFQYIGFIENKDDYEKMWKLSSQKVLTRQFLSL